MYSNLVKDLVEDQKIVFTKYLCGDKKYLLKFPTAEKLDYFQEEEERPAGVQHDPDYFKLIKGCNTVLITSSVSMHAPIYS